MQTVKVRFMGSNSTYDYLDATDKAEEGGYVVVKTGNQHPVVVEVVQTIPGRQPKATALVVQVVDMSGWHNRCKNEKRIRELQEQLDSRVKKFSDEHALKLLCANDSNAAAMKRELDYALAGLHNE